MMGEYDAGYENCIDSMVRQMEDMQFRIDNLHRENAKLRDELDFCLKYVPKCDECEAMLDCDECLRADASQKERKRLDYENAKLRELVRTLHHCAARGECSVCAMRDGRGLDEDTVCFAAHDRMRELGVDA